MLYRTIFLFAFHSLICFNPALVRDPRFDPDDIETFTQQTYRDLLADRGQDLVLAQVATHDKSGSWYEHIFDAESLARYIIREVNKFSKNKPSALEFSKWAVNNCINPINKLLIDTVVTYPSAQTTSEPKKYDRLASETNLLLFIIEHAPRHDLTRQECLALGFFFATLRTKVSLENACYYYIKIIDDPASTLPERKRAYELLAHCSWLLGDGEGQKKYLTLHLEQFSDKTSEEALEAYERLARFYAETDVPADHAHACAYANHIINCPTSRVLLKNDMRLLVARLSPKSTAL